MIIKAISFKRTKDSTWEKGICFECNGNMNTRIIDKDGNLLEVDKDGICIYDGKDRLDILCIDLTNLIK